MGWKHQQGRVIASVDEDFYPPRSPLLWGKGSVLMDFSVLVQLTELGPRSFPLSGVNELEPDWQGTVIDIITKPPVSQVLKVSVYTRSLSEAVPVALVERPPIPLAV